MALFNVIIFGEPGSGKSSLVNLLLDTDIAVVSNSASGHDFKKYQAGIYTFYETVGLAEASRATLGYSIAVKQLTNWIQSLEDGVALLIFVVKLGRINSRMADNYKLFAEKICMGKVPVIMAVTYGDQVKSAWQWWGTNKDKFDKCGMTFNDVVIGCFLKAENTPPVYDKDAVLEENRHTLLQLQAAIQVHKLPFGWRLYGDWGPMAPWLQNAFFKTIKTVCKFLGVR